MGQKAGATAMNTEKQMPIGKVVQRSIPAIFEYCETQDPTEFSRLQDARYSKDTFDVNYPFCQPIAKIGPDQSRRFWVKRYSVHGVTVRVTSQWFNPPTSNSLPLLLTYLERRGLLAQIGSHSERVSGVDSVKNGSKPSTNPKHRNAIGNAQNLFVRHLLSSVSDDDFSAEDWQGTVESFGNRCAYCGSKDALSMDHVVPLNKTALGLHCLGNLVPACRSCNTKKSAKDFREFLSGDAGKIAAIEAHMEKHGYTPAQDAMALRKVIDLAHQDVRAMADRYVIILQTTLQQKGS